MVRSRLYSIIIIASLAGFAWITYLHIQGFNNCQPSVCMIKSITGIPCPSCGTSRSVMLIMEGNYLGALKINPLGFLISFLLLVCPVWVLVDTVMKRSSFLRFYHTMESIIRIKWVTILMITLVTANWIWNIMKGI